MTLIWMLLLVSSIGGLECSRSKRDAKLLVNSENVPPTEISQELQYKKYENHFPVPVLENVYEGWDPVDHGHPLKDETLYYAPPSLERVVFSQQGPQSRSIDDEVFKMPKGPIVIPAQPKTKPKSDLYSVYGSPDINYSAFYERPPSDNAQSRSVDSNARHREFLEDGREFFLNSALDSRSADTRDYPLLWAPYHHRREEPNALEPVESHGGGLQMIKPPNRKKKTTEYFYYREDSPHYKDKLNKKPHREELDNEIISIDGIIVGPKNTITTNKYPEDLEYEESRVRDVRPPPPSPTKANAVVYSFKNNYGLKEQVGVIYEENPKTEQVTKIFNKQQMAQDRHDTATRHNNNNSPGAGSQSSNFIPLEKKPEVKSQPQSFPLGNPFGGPVLKARPEFFPALHYPPLYKTKPAKLEGSFGPPLPPKPEPDVIHFPDEELPGVVREAPKPAPVRPKLPRNNDQQHHVYKTVRDMDYSRPKDILSVRPSGELYVPDPREAHAPLGDVEPRIPILPGVGSFEDLEYIDQDYVDPADDRIWKADFSDVLEGGDEEQDHEHVHTDSGFPALSDIFTLRPAAPPLDLDLSGSIRDPVVFKDEQYKKPGSSFKFPGKSTSDSIIRPIGGSNRKPPPSMLNKLIDIAKGPTSENVEHQYSVVIGLNYDDENPDVVVKDYDEDIDDQPYSPNELYELCIKEVPSHLHRELCGYIRDGKPASAIPSSKQLPAKPSRLIQDNPFQAPIQQNSFEVVKQDHSHNPFAGIPTELPVQISKSPLVITSNSKVKIYKPFEGTPSVATTTTTTTTFRTTTTTPTMRAPPPRPSTTPIPVATPPSSSSSVHSLRNRNRPLIFSKRDPDTGETKLSQPFEYFNRLTHFFNNRVNSQQHPQQRRRPPPPPRLQRQRIRLPPPT